MTMAREPVTARNSDALYDTSLRWKPNAYPVRANHRTSPPSLRTCLRSRTSSVKGQGIWNWRLLSRIDAAYARTLRFPWSHRS